MKGKIFFRIWALLPAVMLLIIFSGCASFKSIVPLNNDRLDAEQGFNTILIIDLEIKDDSSSLQTCGNPSLWEFYRGEAGNKNRMTQYIFPAVWNQSDGSYVLHRTMDLGTIAGTHKISTVSFTCGNRSYAYKIFRQFEVFPCSINYLGKIRITVDKNGSYKADIENDEASRMKALAKFRTANPSLYNQYRNEIKDVRTEVFTDVAW